MNFHSFITNCYQILIIPQTESADQGAPIMTEHRTLHRVALTAAALFTMSFSSFAAKYSVSSASDLQNLENKLKPGDEVIWENGSYHNQKIEVNFEGSAGNLITIKAENRGEAMFSGESYLRISGKHVKVDGLYFSDGKLASDKGMLEFTSAAENCTVSYCTFKNFTGAAESKYVSISGYKNEVSYCNISDKDFEGAMIVVWTSDVDTNIGARHRIHHNYIADIPPGTESNGFEAIRIGDSKNSLKNTKVKVEYNFFENCSGEIEIISNKGCQNEYRGNVFVGCAGALTLRHGHENWVVGNLFFGNGNKESGGVRIINHDQTVINNYFQDLEGNGYRSAISFVNGEDDAELNRYDRVRRALVAFNTIVNCREGIAIGEGKGKDDQSMAPRDCDILYNVVQGDKDLVTFTDTPIEFTWKGNIFSQTVSGIDSKENSFTDPRLELSEERWMPAQDSPAIDAISEHVREIEKDIRGISRSNPDAGSDEYTEAFFPNTGIIKRGDVGPEVKESKSPGILSFSDSSFSVKEPFSGSHTEFPITVDRIGGSTGEVSVSVVINEKEGTAETGDYSVSTSTLKWDDGDSSSKQLVITVIGDDRAEGDETIHFYLAAPTNGAVLTEGDLTAAKVELVEKGWQQFIAEQFPRPDSAGKSFFEDGINPMETVDGSGLTALQKYVFHSEDANRSITPRMVVNGKQSGLEFQWNTSAEEVTIQVERSHNLSSNNVWEPVLHRNASDNGWHTADDFTVEESNGTVTLWYQPEASTPQRCFFRTRSALGNEVTPAGLIENTTDNFMIVQAELPNNKINSDAWEILHHADAAGGSYLRSKKKNTSSASEDGILQFNYNMAASADVRVYVRMINPDSSSDSLFIRQDISQNWSQWSDGIKRTTSWAWKLWNQVTLPKGDGIMEITYREPNVSIDQIMITTDLTFEPSGLDGGQP